MHPDYPEPVEFVIPQERERVTGEPIPPEGAGRALIHFSDLRKMGGGYVPPDYEWPSSPKQDQEEYGVSQIAGAAGIVRLTKKAHVIERGHAGGLPTG